MSNDRVEFFTEKDFDVPVCSNKMYANIANAKLNAALGPEVFSHEIEQDRPNSWMNKRYDWHTYKSRLFQITELEKEKPKCEHSAMIIVDGITNYITGYKCTKCGVKLKPAFTEAEGE